MVIAQAFSVPDVAEVCDPGFSSVSVLLHDGVGTFGARCTFWTVSLFPPLARWPYRADERSVRRFPICDWNAISLFCDVV